MVCIKIILSWSEVTRTTSLFILWNYSSSIWNTGYLGGLEECNSRNVWWCVFVCVCSCLCLSVVCLCADLVNLCLVCLFLGVSMRVPCGSVSVCVCMYVCVYLVVLCVYITEWAEVDTAVIISLEIKKQGSEEVVQCSAASSWVWSWCLTLNPNQCVYCLLILTQ